MEKKITIDEWLDILETTVTEIYDRFSDDGKISIADGVAIFVCVLRAVAKAYKN